MGRKARLRKERKLSSSSTQQINQPQDESILARASSLVKQPDASSDEQSSWNKKFWDWINPLPKLDQYQTGIDVSEFEQENQVLLAAIAWEGFEKHGKGLVLVQQRQDSPTNFQYISRIRLKKRMKKQGVERESIQVMEEQIKSYHPEEDVIIVHVNQEGEIFTSISAKQDPSPPECYKMMNL